MDNAVSQELMQELFGIGFFKKSYPQFDTSYLLNELPRFIDWKGRHFCLIIEPLQRGDPEWFVSYTDEDYHCPTVLGGEEFPFETYDISLKNAVCEMIIVLHRYELIAF